MYIENKLYFKFVFKKRQTYNRQLQYGVERAKLMCFIFSLVWVAFY